VAPLLKEARKTFGPALLDLTAERAA
jgi:hypothetical protein